MVAPVMSSRLAASATSTTCPWPSVRLSVPPAAMAATEPLEDAMVATGTVICTDVLGWVPMTAR